jgi:hypothetical protein
VKGLEKSGDQVEGDGEVADAIAAQVINLLIMIMSQYFFAIKCT